MRVSVKVRLFASMRDYAGVKDADVQGKNVAEVLDSLVNAPGSGNNPVNW
jgi:molybdopterin converting factor small subunit